MGAGRRNRAGRFAEEVAEITGKAFVTVTTRHEGTVTATFEGVYFEVDTRTFHD